MKRWLRYAGWILLVVSFVFLGRWIARLEPEVWQRLRHMHAGWLVASGALFVAWFALRGWLWWKMGSWHGYDRAALVGMRLWTRSELMRYVPGNIWSFAARFQGSRDGGVGRGHSIGILAAEAMALCLGAGAASLALLFGPMGWLGAILLIGIGVLGYPFALRLAKVVLKREVQTELTAQRLLFITVCQTAGWFLFGVASWCIARAWPEPLSFSVTNYAGVSVLAWLIGYVSVVTPMGLGVREVAFAGLLANTLAPGIASLLAVITRLVMILAELVFFGLIHLTALKRSSLKRVEESARV